MSLVPWLAQPWNALAAALTEQRLHHALLITGQAGLGKRALADALVAAALCGSRGTDGHACGQCRSCRLLAAGSHPDRVLVTFEMKDDGKPRSELTVDQIRRLSQRFALSSQFGGLQLALIDPADALNPSAANALLKTLEEPGASCVIVLVTDRPSRLPATIRSRCQRIKLHVPPREVAQAWLETQGMTAGSAARALDASLGNPGRALDSSRDQSLALRDGCAQDLAELSAGRLTPATVAERWMADRVRERLWFAAVLGRDEARQLAAGHRGTLGLTGRGQIPKLAAWFDQANRARGLLDTPLRAELVVLELLRSWPRAQAREETGLRRSAGGTPTKSAAR
ncbi:MAG TPA: DNA polymerase III subunit delta' [Rhodanobacteraceae bacterium]|nr:DNA polymerase III subunit delta' [Rhodanobacteraceae bacterium]